MVATDPPFSHYLDEDRLQAHRYNTDISLLAHISKAANNYACGSKLTIHLESILVMKTGASTFVDSPQQADNYSSHQEML